MPHKSLDVSIGVSSVLSIHILYSSLLLVLLVRCVIINIEQYAEHEQCAVLQFACVTTIRMMLPKTIFERESVCRKSLSFFSLDSSKSPTIRIENQISTSTF